MYWFVSFVPHPKGLINKDMIAAGGFHPPTYSGVPSPPPTAGIPMQHISPACLSPNFPKVFLSIAPFPATAYVCICCEKGKCSILDLYYGLGIE